MPKAMNVGGRFAPLTVISKTWRLLMATTAFAIFGVCGVLFGYIVFPLLHVIADSDRAERWCRRTLQLGFRTLVSFLTFVGLLRCTLRGNTEPLTWRGVLIVANHPSLIDVIILVSYLPGRHMRREGRCVAQPVLRSRRTCGWLCSSKAGKRSRRSNGIANSCRRDSPYFFQKVRGHRLARSP